MSGLRELNALMNSNDCGPSPSMFFRCSAPASLDNVVVYVMISRKDSSSRGSSRWRRGNAQVMRSVDMILPSLDSNGEQL